MWRGGEWCDTGRDRDNITACGGGGEGRGVEPHFLKTRRDR